MIDHLVGPSSASYKSAVLKMKQLIESAHDIGPNTPFRPASTTLAGVMPNSIQNPVSDLACDDNQSQPCNSARAPGEGLDIATDDWIFWRG